MFSRATAREYFAAGRLESPVCVVSPETLGCHGAVTLETAAKLAAGSGADAAAHRRLRLGKSRFRIAANAPRRMSGPLGS